MTNGKQQTISVVFLSDDFPPRSFGGAGISTYELAQSVKHAGHEVSVITTCRDQNEAGKSEYEGLTVFTIASDYHERWRAWRGLYNPPVVRQVEQLLRELRPDVVHANNLHYHLSYQCLKTAKKYAQTVVITFRDTMSVCYGKLHTERYLDHLDGRTTWFDHLKQARLRYNPLRNIVIRYYLRYADKRRAVSEALARVLEANAVRGVEAIQTGVDIQAWEAREGAVGGFKKRYGLEHKKIILFGGRLSTPKGGMTALEALAKVAEEMHDAVLLVAGKKEGFAGGMRERAAALGIEARIVFTGWIKGEDLRAAYAAADVVWVPSIYLDPLPRIVLEAMASGKPVIGSRYGGTPEAVVDGVTGYIVDPRHAEDVAGKTLDLLRHPEKAHAFGEAGQERIRTRFNLDNVAGQYIELYRAR